MATPSDPPRQLLTLPNGMVAYIDEGSGPTVLAVHGLPGSARDFRWLAPALCSDDAAPARLVRVDLPGFGETSVATEPDPSPQGRARVVLALCAALGLERPVLLGHSMGGIVATAAAALNPAAFSGLALVSSPGLRPHASLRELPVAQVRWLVKHPWLLRRLRPLTRRVFAQAGFVGYPDQALERTLACVGATSITQHARRVHALALPTLVAWCEDDPMVDPDILAELANACPPGPRLRFATGGHNPQKTHAQELAQALRTWMAALVPPPGSPRPP
ncbi:MAG: alpha/beta hydrolase [Oligoflexia bacterium]|nr:alpha/beta hydrolase [Oligoflexia bacterium]